MEILKRGKRYATLLLIVKATVTRSPRTEFEVLRQAIWKGLGFSSGRVRKMRAGKLRINN